MPIIPQAPVTRREKIPLADESLIQSESSRTTSIIRQSESLIGSVVDAFRTVKKAQDQVDILNAEQLLDSMLREEMDSFSVRTDYHEFDSDVMESVKKIKNELSSKYGSNADVWRALSPHIEGKLNEFIYTIGKRKMELLRDSATAAMSQKMNSAIADYVHAETGDERNRIKSTIEMDVRILAAGSVIDRNQANKLLEWFNESVESAEIVSASESGDTEKIKGVLERIADPNEFRALKAKNPSSLMSAAANLRKKVETIDASSSAMRAVDEIWNRNIGGDYDLNSPVPTETMYRQLLDHPAIKGNRDAYDIAYQDLSRRIAAREKQQDEFSRAAKDGLWKHFLSGMQLADIVKTPEFSRLGGTQQMEFIEKVNSINEARMRAQITEAEKDIVSTSRVVNELKARTELNFLMNSGSYILDSQPENLKRMSESEIMAKIPVYGADRVQDLLERKRRLESDSGVSVLGTEDMIQNAAYRMEIIPPSGKWTSEQRTAYAMFSSAVYRKIREYEQMNLEGKRKANQDEVMQVIDGMLLDKVRIESLFRDPEKFTFAITPEESSKAYVEVNGENIYMTDIPEEQMRKYYSLIVMSGGTPTFQNIANVWVAAGKPGRRKKK
ncbi:MAG: hypothetical protein N3A02_06045 [Rectinema sp.]|nr:hypothetical protein [Rectinema sp.]